MKFKIPLYQSHAAANQDYLDLAGPAAEGVRMPVAPLVLSGKLEIGDPVRPVIAAYNKLYLGRWEVLPSVYGAHAHDAIQILIAAIRKARSTNKAALRRTIEATRGLVGTSGISDQRRRSSGARRDLLAHGQSAVRGVGTGGLISCFLNGGGVKIRP
jgi:branched-chain amino acid transport system substrate-binding protein